nr:MAG TPA: hypothetical protein [Caudoviricetes sp.]
MSYSSFFTIQKFLCYNLTTLIRKEVLPCHSLKI